MHIPYSAPSTLCRPIGIEKTILLANGKREKADDVTPAWVAVDPPAADNQGASCLLDCGAPSSSYLEREGAAVVCRVATS